LTEVVFASASGPGGSWSGPDAKPHEMANHNLYTDSAWFFPALLLKRALLSPHQSLTYVGEETRSDRPVLHLSVSQQFPGLNSEAAAMLQRLSQMDLFLDPSSHLPIALVFNVHPDNNLLLNIPVEIHFSDYRTVNGIQIPFHVEKFLNNSLLLDLQFQNVALNTGLSSSQVGAQ
jgi:hypothetical protein